MKKLCIAVALAGSLATFSLQAVLVFDGSLSLVGGAYQNGQGGEFTVASTPIGSNPNLDGFQTFCTEVNEHLVLNGSKYDYKQNIGAVLGGAGTDAFDPNTGFVMDTTSIGTAYLYSEFRKGAAGALANPLYFGGTGYFGGNRNAHAGELQNAIWALENEGGGLSANITAILTAGLPGGNWAAPSGGAFGVISLNLYNGQGGTPATAPNGTPYIVNQDILALVPEPTTMIAGALLLLPFGASTIRMLRRKA